MRREAFGAIFFIAFRLDRLLTGCRCHTRDTLLYRPELSVRMVSDDIASLQKLRVTSPLGNKRLSWILPAAEQVGGEFGRL